MSEITLNIEILILFLVLLASTIQTAFILFISVQIYSR